jgi:DNA-binding transcriptional ArsR family regulator
MSLYTNEVAIENVITAAPRKAKAVENDVRAKILDMLAHEEMTIEEIHAELTRRGEDKAETTVRHHVNILKDAEMVEIARLEEAQGGTLKYYRSNTRVFSHELPDNAEEPFEKMSNTTRSELTSLVNTLYAEHGDEIKALADEIKPCEYCSRKHHEEYIIHELLDQTLTDIIENDELSEYFD